jgi:hypothetical protein
MLNGLEQRESSVSDRKSATSSKYMVATGGLNDPVTRQTVAIVLIMVPSVCGAIALYRLGTNPVTLEWVTGVVMSFGALGGWIHHPVRRFRVRGALAGILAAGGALLAMYFYVAWRGGEQKVLFNFELLIPLVIGAAPGVYAYYSLLRGETVAPWEEPTNKG